MAPTPLSGATMRPILLLALVGCLLTIAPAASAGPDTGGCAQYPTHDGIQVAACNDDEGNRCALVYNGGSRAYACAPYPLD